MTIANNSLYTSPKIYITLFVLSRTGQMVPYRLHCVFIWRVMMTVKWKWISAYLIRQSYVVWFMRSV